MQKYEAEKLAQQAALAPETHGRPQSIDAGHRPAPTEPRTDHHPDPAVVTAEPESVNDSTAEKEEIMERMSPSTKENPAKDYKRQGTRTVQDPVTGTQVVIRDATLDPNEGMQAIFLSPSSPEH